MEEALNVEVKSEVWTRLMEMIALNCAVPCAATKGSSSCQIGVVESWQTIDDLAGEPGQLALRYRSEL